MRWSPEAVAARRTVWSAFAELYLDTEVARSYETCACTLASTSLTLRELHDILLDEVHPALYPNLLNVAGVWSGFDEDWLVQRILDRQAVPRWRRVGGWLLRHHAQELWREIAPRVVEYRGGRRYFLPLPTTEST